MIFDFMVMSSNIQPDTVRKCESEGRSSFDYGIGNRPDRVRYKHRFIDEKGGIGHEP